jgi:cytoplasmic tRNA 2-thiolation protein 1
MSTTCKRCTLNKAILKRPKNGDTLCKECFFYVFEEEIHNTITNAKLFKPGETVAVGASGGKVSQYANKS